MTDDKDWTDIAGVYLTHSQELATGIMIGPDMIAAGAEAVRRLAAAGASPEAIAEEVYMQMRMVAGEGRVQRRIQATSEEIEGGARPLRERPRR